MACPFPLIGTFDLMDDAFQKALEPQLLVQGCNNWDNVKEGSYQDVIVMDDKTLVSDAPCDDDWKTTKALQLERIPNYWCGNCPIL